MYFSIPPPFLLEMFVIMTVEAGAVGMEQKWREEYHTLLLSFYDFDSSPSSPASKYRRTQTCHMDWRKTEREAKSREPWWCVGWSPRRQQKIVGLFLYIPSTMMGLNNPDVNYWASCTYIPVVVIDISLHSSQVCDTSYLCMHTPTEYYIDVHHLLNLFALLIEREMKWYHHWCKRVWDIAMKCDQVLKFIDEHWKRNSCQKFFDDLRLNLLVFCPFMTLITERLEGCTWSAAFPA
jgi:hypothetical protein